MSLNEVAKTPEDLKSKSEFINEIKEISEEQEIKTQEDEKIVIEDESVRFSNNKEHFNNENSDNYRGSIDSQNDVNDDLLQIPAFLRRQAN